MASPDRARAEQTAEQVLSERGISTLPVDPIAIAGERRIEVKAKPNTAVGVSGMLIRVDQSYGILYATHIASEGFQRFSIGHELGHYFLPGHLDAVHATSDVHQSRAGFLSQDPYEIEADCFAAALLMPDKPFRTALLRESENGLEAIKTLAKLCKTSLPATAIRFVDRITIPAAIVVSTGQRIDYAFLSPSMKEFRGLTWLRKEDPLPPSSLTHKFNKKPGNVSGGHQDAGTGDLRDWFDGPRSLEIAEEVVGLGAYGKTLTVLTSEVLAEEVDEEENLKESWRPKWR